MYQKIVLVGNLGNDPEMRYMPDGKPVTSFSLATNRRWSDRQSGDQREETVWWRVSVFGNQAEACNQYLSKGRMALVEGRVRPDPRPLPGKLSTGTPASRGARTGYRTANARSRTAVGAPGPPGRAASTRRR